MNRSAPAFRMAEQGNDRVLFYDFPGKENSRISVSLIARGRLADQFSAFPESIGKLLTKDSDEPVTISPFQVHGTAMIDALPLWSLPCRPSADAVYAGSPGAVATLRFADCFPVVALNRGSDETFVLMHSGFRGACRGIVPAVLDRLRKRRFLNERENLFAFVGPGVGQCCYDRRVDDPWTMEGMKRFPSFCWNREGENVTFDIGGTIVRQLVQAGIDSSNIALSKYCTSCSRDIFYSYRSGDAKKRNVLVGFLRPKGHKQTFWWENTYSGD